MTTQRYVAFLRGISPMTIVTESARILTLRQGGIFSAYVPGPKAPVFMGLLERTFGKQVTTRTWETVAKCLK